jgi:hypothetical protein
MKNPETSRKATPKSPEIEAYLATFLGGVSRVGAVAESSCASCLCMVGEFRDALSEKEYTISGLCQTCQDSVFG